MAKTNFNMQLTDTEKEIMDFVTEVVYQEYNFSKADMVSMLFKNSAINYLQLGVEPHQISDEELLALLKYQKRETDKTNARMIGIDQYRTIISTFIQQYPDFDPSYMQGILKEIEEEKANDRM